jgi:dolichol-phosphate mannosyltransferase
MVPLRIATYIGALLTTVLTFVGIGAVISWILSGTVPGWTSLTLLVVMISSVQLLVLGLIGEYVGRTYIQSKNRPLFLISHIHRRGRLPGPLPHDPADAPKDIEESQLKTLLAHSGPEKRNQVFDEIS